MENDFEKQLKKELHSEGASEYETGELLGILDKISKSSKIERSQAFKRSFLENLSKKEMGKKGIFFFTPRIYMPALAFVLLLFIFIAGIVNAQTSQPGQPLYPVKILSENIVKTINPSFKGEILRRRSEEIKSLAEQKKDSNLLKKTIDEYKSELEGKKDINTVKIEESKKNLEDARNNSEDENKKEIERVIIQTENKINEDHDDNKDKEVQEVKGVGLHGGSSQDEDNKDNRDKSEDD